MKGLGIRWVKNSSASGLSDKFIYIFVCLANFQWVLKVVLGAEAKETHFGSCDFKRMMEWHCKTSRKTSPYLILEGFFCGVPVKPF